MMDLSRLGYMDVDRRASRRGFLRLLGSRAGLVVVLAAIPAALLAQGREPPARADFGHLAEGFTSARAGGTIEAGYRMFTAPDFKEACERARANEVRQLRATSSRLRLQVGTPFRLSSLKIDALDMAGALLPKVPITIESEIPSDVLDARSDRLAAFGSVTPVMAGAVHLRIRKICDAPGVETFITAQVTP